MSDIVTVSVAQGKLRGREATTKSGGTYYSFQGIPYAKPPVGALRFKVSGSYYSRVNNI
jgi:carboxylesterase type B